MSLVDPNLSHVGAPKLQKRESALAKHIVKPQLPLDPCLLLPSQALPSYREDSPTEAPDYLLPSSFQSTSGHRSPVPGYPESLAQCGHRLDGHKGSAGHRRVATRTMSWQEERSLHTPSQKKWQDVPAWVQEQVRT